MECSAFWVYGVSSDPPPKSSRRGKSIGQLMAEAAKGINPEITPEVTEVVKETAAEVTEEVKEATAGMVDQLRPVTKRRAWYYWTS
jgi:hypothetical protein